MELRKLVIPATFEEILKLYHDYKRLIFNVWCNMHYHELKISKQSMLTQITSIVKSNDPQRSIKACIGIRILGKIHPIRLDELLRQLSNLLPCEEKAYSDFISYILAKFCRRHYLKELRFITYQLSRCNQWLHESFPSSQVTCALQILHWFAQFASSAILSSSQQFFDALSVGQFHQNCEVRMKCFSIGNTFHERSIKIPTVLPVFDIFNKSLSLINSEKVNEIHGSLLVLSNYARNHPSVISERAASLMNTCRFLMQHDQKCIATAAVNLLVDLGPLDPVEFRTKHCQALNLALFGSQKIPLDLANQLISAMKCFPDIFATKIPEIISFLQGMIQHIKYHDKSQNNESININPKTDNLISDNLEQPNEMNDNDQLIDKNENDSVGNELQDKDDESIEKNKNSEILTACFKLIHAISEIIPSEFPNIPVIREILLDSPLNNDFYTIITPLFANYHDLWNRIKNEICERLLKIKKFIPVHLNIISVLPSLSDSQNEKLYELIHPLLYNSDPEIKSRIPAALFALNKDIYSESYANLLNKILSICVSETSPTIRLAILKSIHPPFSPYLSYPDQLEFFSLLVNDDSFSVRREALYILGELSVNNPSMILPIFRRVLLDALFICDSSPLLRLQAQTTRCLTMIIQFADPILPVYIPVFIPIALNYLHLRFAHKEPGAENDTDTPFLCQHLPVSISFHESQDSVNASLIQRVSQQTIFEQEYSAYVVVNFIDTIALSCQKQRSLLEEKYVEITNLFLDILEQNTNKLIAISCLKALSYIIDFIGPNAITGFPTLLTTLFNLGSKFTSTKIHAGIFKVYGRFGPITPIDIYESNLQPENDEQNILDVSQIGSQISYSDWYLSISASAILFILEDTNLSSLHFHALKLLSSWPLITSPSSQPFFNKFVRYLFMAVRTAPADEKEQYFPLIHTILQNDREWMKPFASHFAKLIEELMDSPFLHHALELTPELVKSLGDAFAPFLPKIVSILLDTLFNTEMTQPRIAIKVLFALTKLSTFASDYVFIILRQMVEVVFNPMLKSDVVLAALLAMTNLVQKYDCSSYMSLLSRSVFQCVIHPEERIRNASIKLLISLNPNTLYDTYKQTAINLLKANNMFNDKAEELIHSLPESPLMTPNNNDDDDSENLEFTNYENLEEKITSNFGSLSNYSSTGNLSTMSSLSGMNNLSSLSGTNSLSGMSSHSKMSDLASMSKNYSNCTNNVTIVTGETTTLSFNKINEHFPISSSENRRRSSNYQNEDLSIDEESLIKSSFCKQTFSPGQWKDWCRTFVLTSIKEAPSRIIQDCYEIAHMCYGFASKLFHSAFLSCWAKLSEKGKNEICINITRALTQTDSGIPMYVLTTLVGLAEFMERTDQHLMISYYSLAKAAQRAEKLPFALFCIQKLEKLNSQSIESLFRIYSQLAMEDDVHGLVHSLRHNEEINITPKLAEQLGDWSTALRLYKENESHETFLSLLGSLSMLNDWNALYDLYHHFDNLPATVKSESARFFAGAFYQKRDWEKYEQTIKHAPSDCVDSIVVQCLANRARNLPYKELVLSGFESLGMNAGPLFPHGFSSLVPFIVQAQQLVELYEASDSNTNAICLEEKWKLRTNNAHLTFQQIQPLLMMRINLLGKENAQNEILTLLKLSRNSGEWTLHDHFFNLYFPNFELNSSNVSVIFEHCVSLWKRQDKDKAIDILNNLIENHLKPQILLNNNHIDDDSIKILYERALITQARWIVRAKCSDNEGETLCKAASICESIMETHRKAKLFFSYTQLRLYNIKEGDRMEHAINAIKGFISSAKGISEMMQLSSIFFRAGKFSKVMDAVENDMKKLKLELWLPLIPQLFSQLSNTNQRLANFAHITIKNALAKHHHLVIIPLLFAQEFQPGAKEICMKMLSDFQKRQPETYQNALIIYAGLLYACMTKTEQWLDALNSINELYKQGNLEEMKNTFERLFSNIKSQKSDSDLLFNRLYAERIAALAPAFRRFFTSKNRRHIESLWPEYRSMCAAMKSDIDGMSSIPTRFVAPLLSDIRNVNIAVPGTYDPTAPKDSINTISKFAASMDVFPSKQRPKRFAIIGKDGREFWYLLKGHEDLRLDQSVVQLFSLINTFIPSSMPKIVTNFIMPLSPSVGVIQWIPGSDTMFKLIREYRATRGLPVDIEARSMIARTIQKFDNLRPIQRLETLREVIKETPDDALADIMWLKAPNAESWVKRISTFSKTSALMSVVGYIIGLGDRHPSNIMIHKFTGSVIHVDFGDCFEFARDRVRFPELIPFRLTRFMIKAFGPSGIDGSFRKSCMDMIGLVRSRREDVMSSLEIFAHAPIVNVGKQQPNINLSCTPENTNNPTTIKSNVNSTSSTDMSTTTTTNNNNNNNSNGIVITFNNSNKNNKNNETSNHLTKISNNNSNNNNNYNNNNNKNNNINITTGSGSVGQSSVGVKANRKNAKDEQEENINKLFERICDKINGNDFNEEKETGHRLTQEEQVSGLIQSATDLYHMAHLYHGWKPLW
ncbi:hypothetical protein TRFO_11408 [Tritrichomonas foetus]|uniref:non-specific serine/threonine protein kinase n=1 Tax=Tritrichomonas foetus TaxID=1144522 RepID=A0A1J4J3U2_9EUKA|nr:hypothetical protein TRFO_11408 [Tritrichomonas foetus]|eukprot:OHS94120.1 hypothetical protein TRFO_11408 [Tritrichomonas foetus]